MKQKNDIKKSKKKTRIQILSEVFAKLTHYTYRIDDTGQEANLEHEEAMARYWAKKFNLPQEDGLVKRSAIHQYAPKITREIDLITHIGKQLNKTYLLTPKLTNEYGWVMIDHIEEYKCPYGSPTNKRNEYLLIPQIIEIDTLQYYMIKGKEKSQSIHSRTVYRLKRDTFTYNFLKHWFKYVYPDNYLFGERFDFRYSDYYKELTPSELWNLEDDIDYLGWFFDQKSNNNELPPNMEKINEALHIIRKMERIILKDPLYDRLKKGYINEGKDNSDYNKTLVPLMKRGEDIRNLVLELSDPEFKRAKKKDMLKNKEKN